ncbi:MAG: helix-turn-helix transcriptional regulator [Candidatus Aenigmarchaeota archaeon]|nr:helix-turn-helix transcriptional regulator [Candidatus Aenigmarchaeota archaeon]
MSMGIERSGVPLTKRELEVLNYITEGKSTEDTAYEMHVSKRTVDFHLANIYEKLGVSNRVQAYRMARQFGLVE